MAGRRKQPSQSSHRPKGRKRPRAYHHGRSQGKVNEKKIKHALPAFERAEADLAETEARAAEHRRQVGDWRELVDELARVNPSPLAPLTVI